MQRRFRLWLAAVVLFALTIGVWAVWARGTDEPHDRVTPGTVAAPPPETTTPTRSSTAVPAPTTTSTTTIPPGRLRADLRRRVKALVAEVDRWSPGSLASISAQPLSPAAGAVGVEAGRHYLSASAAKAYWAAAAVDAVGPGPVEPLAREVFALSDNDAAGSVIGLVGGDAVNRFMTGPAGAVDTSFVFWSHGGPHSSSAYPGPYGGNNYTTTGDAVRFLARLDRGELLGRRGTDAMRRWLALSPDNRSHGTPLGGLLGDRLPPEVQPGVLHKAGWLPEPFIEDGPATPFDYLVFDLGIVTSPPGDRYAVAIGISGGSDFVGKAEFVAHASCEIYAVAARAPELDCGPPP